MKSTKYQIILNDDGAYLEDTYYNIGLQLGSAHEAHLLREQLETLENKNQAMLTVLQNILKCEDISAEAHEQVVLVLANQYKK